MVNVPETIEDPTHCPACGQRHRQHGICQKCSEHTDWEYSGGFGQSPLIRRCQACGQEHSANQRRKINMMETNRIFTHGTCTEDPGPGGYAAVIQAGSKQQIVASGEPDTTTGRMMLKAMIAGLRAARNMERKPDSPTILETDDQHIVDRFERGGTERNQSRLYQDEFPNNNLWEELMEEARMLGGVSIIQTVPGRATEKCRQLAKEMAVLTEENGFNPLYYPRPTDLETEPSQATPESQTTPESHPDQEETPSRCGECGNVLPHRRVMVRTQPCWQCGQDLKVATGERDAQSGEEHPEIYPNQFTQEETQFLKTQGVNLEIRYSRDLNRRYLGNTCPACSHLQGNWHVYHDPPEGLPKENVAEMFQTGPCDLCAERKCPTHGSYLDYDGEQNCPGCLSDSYSVFCKDQGLLKCHQPRECEEKGCVIRAAAGKNRPASVVITTCPETRRRPDRWVIIAHGILVYGETREQVDRSFQDGLNVMIQSFRGDRKRVKTWLDANKIEYAFDPVKLREVEYPERQIAIPLD